jgi:hypothetical protein
MPFDRDIIEAKISLHLILSNELPLLAVDALEAGFDGPAVRRLAALHPMASFEIAEALPRAMSEMGMTFMEPGQAGLRLARYLCRQTLAAEDPLPELFKLEGLYYRSGYPHELAALGILEDEVDLARNRGESETEIRSWVVEGLKSYLV